MRHKPPLFDFMERTENQGNPSVTIKLTTTKALKYGAGVNMLTLYSSSVTDEASFLPIIGKTYGDVTAII